VASLGLKEYGWNVSTVGLIVSIASLIVTLYVQNRVAVVQTTVQGLVPDLSIASPGNGGDVGEVETIRGVTRFTDRRIYVIVTPAVDGIPWVQGPASLSAGGLWTCPARFGDRQSSIGQSYSVYSIATKTALRSGHLTFVPPDKVMSATINVTRTR
jgi:hypothetical protein